MINDGKDYKEMYEMIPQRKQVHVKNGFFWSKVSYELKKQATTTRAVFFVTGPKQKLPVWRPYQQRPISETILATRSEPDKNGQELIQVKTSYLFSQNPKQLSVPKKRKKI